MGWWNDEAIMEVRTVAAVTRLSRPVDPEARRVDAACRDPREFAALYERYFDRVLGYVRLRVHDAATCEDITSQVFTTALAQLGRFRGEGTFGAWLFQIARNAVHDAFRRPVFEELSEEVPGPALKFEQRLIDEERAAELRRLLASLEPAQQHLIALRYGAELSFEQIGDILDTSAGAARVRLHRLLHDLRERYAHEE
jgi:RNA polymerase sigma-70 factor (ECF subfamily)